MKLREIIDIAITYLNLNDELKVLGVNTTPLSNKKLKLLIRCANVVNTEIATDFIRLVNTEKMTVEGGKVDYHGFSKRVIDIVSVIKEGERIRFTAYPNYLAIGETDGEVEINYNYLPEEIGLDDEMAFSARVSPTTFAAGIVAEYSLVNNMYEEAVAYERKFRDGLKANISRNAAGYVRSRRWV